MNFSKLSGFGKVLAVALVITLVFFAGVIIERYIINSPRLGKSETVSEFGGMECASYVIFKEGSTYYARNGKTGTIDYSGTNATQIIQNCLDNTHERGIVHLKNGIYVIDSGLLLPSGWTLEGDNMYYTIIQQASGANLSFMIRSRASSWVEVYQTIKSIGLDGNRANSGTNPTIGIKLQCFRGLIDRVWVHDTKGTAIEVVGFLGNKAIENIIQNVVIEDVDLHGINIASYAPDNYVLGVTIGRTSAIGIRTISWDTFISDCHVYATGGTSISLNGASLSHLTDIYIEGSGNQGIHLSNSAQNCTLTNIVVQNSMMDGIRIEDSSFNIITNAICHDKSTAFHLMPTQDWGINEVGTSDHNIIVAVATHGNVNGGINIVGLNTKCNLSWNETHWIP